MNFEVNIHKTFENDKPLMAICSVTMDGQFAVHGVRVFKNQNGRHIAMPCESYKDTKGNTQYKDVFHPITNEAYRAMEAAVFKAYGAKVKA